MASNKVDFNLVRTASRETLSKMLDDVPGNKAIVWEKDLAGTFSLVGDFTFLSHHKVTQMFYLNEKRVLSPTGIDTHIIFITKPHTASMDQVNQYLRGLVSNTPPTVRPPRQLHLWLVPRCSLLCERRLQHHGTLDLFTAVTELPVLLFKMEHDLVSMELPDAFSEMAVHGDPSSVHLAARAVMLLQGLFGVIPAIQGKGAGAGMLYTMLVELRREMAHAEPQAAPKIDQLIVLDRSVDLLTPLTTQLTYEGLIDTCYGIRNCVVALPGNRVQHLEPPDAMPLAEDSVKNLQLSSTDALYTELRDANFSSVGPKLAAQAKQITREFEERHQAKTVVEMKQFVQKLPGIQSAKVKLALHTSVAELLQEAVSGSVWGGALQVEQELLRGGGDPDKPNAFVEDCIARKTPLLTVLRLMCFQSVINNGLKPKLLEYYKREVVHTYGYHHILTLDNLDQAGLLTAQRGKAHYATTRKTLRLIVDDVNELNPTDIAYVHSGYAPLSVRLAAFVHSPGWRAITELLALLPGHTLAETQRGGRHRRTDSSASADGGINPDSGPSVVLVLFLGGCTYSEVAALRFLSARSQDTGGPEYVIATTGLINSNSFLRSLSTDLLPDSVEDTL